MAGRIRYKNIKIRRETYDRLASIQEPGESFDRVLNRLLDRVRELEERVAELERMVPLEVEKRVRERVASLAEERVRKEVDSVQLDKASWYITKLVFSIQSLKSLIQLGAQQQDIEKQLKRLEKVLQQVRERYGVETRTLYEIAKQFSEEPTRENLILLNEATKEVVKSIFIKMLSIEVIR